MCCEHALLQYEFLFQFIILPTMKLNKFSMHGFMLSCQIGGEIFLSLLVDTKVKLELERKFLCRAKCVNNEMWIFHLK